MGNCFQKDTTQFICIYCNIQGLKSTIKRYTSDCDDLLTVVYRSGEKIERSPYYDENGKYHMGSKLSRYRCSNNHNIYREETYD